MYIDKLTKCDSILAILLNPCSKIWRRQSLPIFLDSTQCIKALFDGKCRDEQWKFDGANIAQFLMFFKNLNVFLNIQFFVPFCEQIYCQFLLEFIDGIQGCHRRSSFPFIADQFCNFKIH